MNIAQLLARPHDMSVGEGFVTEMAAVGFAELTIAGYMNSAIHFGGWLEAQGVSLSGIDENTVKAFGAHCCQCPGHRSRKRLSRHYLARVERFAGYLAKRGVTQPVANTVPETPTSLIAFRQWVLQHRGLSPVTVARHERLMKLMLPALGTDAGDYTATAVRIQKFNTEVLIPVSGQKSRGGAGAPRPEAG